MGALLTGKAAPDSMRIPVSREEDGEQYSRTCHVLSGLHKDHIYVVYICAYTIYKHTLHTLEYTHIQEISVLSNKQRRLFSVRLSPNIHQILEPPNPALLGYMVFELSHTD